MNKKDASLALLAIDPDLSAMEIYDVFGQSRSDTHPAKRAGRVFFYLAKALKNDLLMFSVNSDSLSAMVTVE